MKAHNNQTKVHYKGADDDFIIFAESEDAVRNWKKDSSIPLVDVVQSFKVLVSHKHGAQGELDTASKAALENEFGTSKDDDVVKQILEKGDLQTSTNSERGSSTNDNKGSLVAN